MTNSNTHDQTDRFCGCLLGLAVGDDADTTAAICGQVAGAFYGESGIPSRWLKRLKMSEEIRGLALSLQDTLKSLS
jgi:ADP-ribosyl-[dinitrogen reductase] hydrolase